MISDSMLSSDWTSTQGILKVDSLSENEKWSAMFAGAAPRFGPLVERIRQHLGSGAKELSQVVAASEAAASDAIENIINAEILAPYGITRSEFIQSGREWFGEIHFGHILDRVTRADLGISLLISGFDSRGKGHVFELTASGTAVRYDDPGFHAIGSGAFIALATLYPHTRLCGGENLYHIIYRMCAAKLAAESAPGVGSHSLVLVQSAEGPDQYVADIPMDDLRKLWRSTGQPPIPPEAEELLRETLRDLE